MQRGFFCVWPTVQDTLAVCGVTVRRTSFLSTVSRVIDSDVLARSALVASLLSKLTCGLYNIPHCATVSFSGLVQLTRLCSVYTSAELRKFKREKSIG